AARAPGARAARSAAPAAPTSSRRVRRGPASTMFTSLPWEDPTSPTHGASLNANSHRVCDVPGRKCDDRPAPARRSAPGRAGSGRELVRRQGQELCEAVRERDLVEHARRVLVAGAELRELLALDLEHALALDAPVPQPLPDLRA